MKQLNVIVYTMEGCPFCEEFKKMLQKENIEFFARDIDEHKEEYDNYSKITENDMVPALLIIEGENDNYKSYLYAPERNYNELTEALGIIQEHRKKVGVI
jgi:glutaredoxin